jgi:hypothetical protein
MLGSHNWDMMHYLSLDDTFLLAFICRQSKVATHEEMAAVSLTAVRKENYTVSYRRALQSLSIRALVR